MIIFNRLKNCIHISKIISLHLFIFFIFYSCKTININGVYVQKDYKRNELHFKKNKTFINLDKFSKTDSSYYRCCDTLSFGIYKIINNSFIELNSPKELSTFYLNLNVIENNIKKDTLYIKINNPIENNYNLNSEREIKYLIYLNSNNKDISNMLKNKIISKNSIKIPINENFEVYDIEIIIYVEPTIRIKEKNVDVINTIFYKILNKKSNSLEINIPKLTYEYINYKRLSNDYIKIISENKMIWDGKEYIKLSD